MLLDTGKKQYKIVREVLQGEVNDIYVCQNRSQPAAPYKTVWIVKNRRIAKELMGNLGGACEECFMHNEDAGFVFAYGGERLLDRFYQNTIQREPASASRVWLELIVKCMTSDLPPAVLNLILRQKQIHISADGSIWFGYFLDLAEYDAQAGEKENVALCALYLVQLIELGLVTKTDAAKNIRVMKLIQKKMDRKKYQDFMQLYRDMKLATRESDLQSRKERLKSAVTSRQDLLYKILSVLSIVLVCIVIFMLAGHLLYGEFSFWKVFGHSFEQIGTESLLQ